MRLDDLTRMVFDSAPADWNETPFQSWSPEGVLKGYTAAYIPDISVAVQFFEDGSEPMIDGDWLADFGVTHARPWSAYLFYNGQVVDAYLGAWIEPRNVVLPLPYEDVDGNDRVDAGEVRLFRLLHGIVEEAEYFAPTEVYDQAVDLMGRNVIVER